MARTAKAFLFVPLSCLLQAHRTTFYLLNLAFNKLFFIELNAIGDYDYLSFDFNNSRNLTRDMKLIGSLILVNGVMVYEETCVVQGIVYIICIYGSVFDQNTNGDMIIQKIKIRFLLYWDYNIIQLARVFSVTPLHLEQKPQKQI